MNMTLADEKQILGLNRAMIFGQVEKDAYVVFDWIMNTQHLYKKLCDVIAIARRYDKFSLSSSQRAMDLFMREEVKPSIDHAWEKFEWGTPPRIKGARSVDMWTLAIKQLDRFIPCPENG